jgi:hypothetical protein
MNDVDSLTPDEFLWRAEDDGALVKIENSGANQ